MKASVDKKRDNEVKIEPGMKCVIRRDGWGHIRFYDYSKTGLYPVHDPSADGKHNLISIGGNYAGGDPWGRIGDIDRRNHIEVIGVTGDEITYRVVGMTAGWFFTCVEDPVLVSRLNIFLQYFEPEELDVDDENDLGTVNEETAETGDAVEKATAST